MENIFSVDVEDYFHPSEVQCYVDASQWDSLPSHVERATGRVLELVARHGVRGTFFVLGWVAEKFPALVRRIADAGHEIACHSHLHRLVYDLTPEEFRRDTERACRAIEDACGQKLWAYRAPSYSITEQSLWALEILVELGFTHDSSIYPVVHDRYGIPGFSRFPQPVQTPSGPILEVPAATVQLSANRVAPVGGGAYLRLPPYRYTAAGIRRINETENRPACIYIHPWELETEMPRLTSGWLSTIRTYARLDGVAAKVDRLLSEFRFTTMSSVYPALS